MIALSKLIIFLLFGISKFFQELEKFVSTWEISSEIIFYCKHLKSRIFCDKIIDKDISREKEFPSSFLRGSRYILQKKCFITLFAAYYFQVLYLTSRVIVK